MSKKKTDVIIQHDRPKIVMLDMSDDCVTALMDAGFAVRTGSLGRPYRVEKTSSYLPFRLNHSLPNLTDLDVLVVDLLDSPVLPESTGEESAPHNGIEHYASGVRGVIDPRTRVAYGIRDELTKAFMFGMVAVVFTDNDIGHQTVYGRKMTYGPDSPTAFDGRVWNLLVPMSGFEVEGTSGEEMVPSDTKSSLGRLVAKHLVSGEYTCTFEPPYQLKDSWISLAQNRYGQSVGGLVSLENRSHLILLPRLANQAEFVLALLTEILPEMVPAMFRDFAPRAWAHQVEYELPEVTSLNEQKEAVVAKADSDLAGLDAAIERERKQSGWLHDLIIGTDDTLVEAVKKALAELGFQRVNDIDAERDKEGKSRREDLQIHDRDHVLIVDVKGVSGGTADDFALQADKHATLRDKEWRRGGPEHHPVIENVTGLAIINHQRHLPPLTRENKNPFRHEMLDTAEEHGTGLLTAWDLYRLLRNKHRLGWSIEQVIPLFYLKGRIIPIPTHYHPIGHVAKAWTDKFGIVLEVDELHVGETIAVEFPILFEQTVVTSMQVNDTKVEVARKGDQVGLLWPSEDCKLREGMVVYAVRPESSKVAEAS